MAKVKHGSNILLLDIETAYKKAAVWSPKQDYIAPNQMLSDFYVLCWSAKWIGDTYIYSDALHYDKPRYKKDPTDDYSVLETVWEMLDKAEYVVGHNMRNFDRKSLNARFIQQGMRPPSPYMVIDTLEIARREFKFTYNRLDSLAIALGVGKKIDTGGFDLWKQIIEKQDISAFNKMVKYCENDVIINEAVYGVLRTWDSRHPNATIGDGDTRPKCNACGSRHVTKQGLKRSITQVYQQYKCQDCGHWMRAASAEKQDKESKQSKLRSI